jgi:hypothetical protein
MQNTPKRLAQAMRARLEADRLERAADLLTAWANDPGRFPGWSPNITDAVQARRRRTESAPNGYHSYMYETSTLDQADGAALALRSAYPEGEARDTPDHALARAEADIRFCKIDGFFPTPPALLDRIIALAGIGEGMTVLEPSAGKGDMAEAAKAAGGVVSCCEVHGSLREILTMKGFEIIEHDCLEMASSERFNRIVMNPPFERGQDREHIQAMYAHLERGGRLVAICSTGPMTRTMRADVEFRQWLDSVGAGVEDVGPGAFADASAFRQTGVAVCIIIINKP